MSATIVTIHGNLVSQPEYLRVGPQDRQLTKLRIASSRRRPTGVQDEHGSEIWEDVDNLYIDAECWGSLANNCRVSLFKGAPVSVTGKLVTKTWSEEGVDETGKPVTQTRSKIMLKATQVSFDLSNYQVLHSARALREELQAQSADDLVAGQDGPAFAETRISAEDVVTFDDVKEDAAAPF
ncbi:single-stranded DNA-binding protein [Corynebacterium glaucum]|uniref:single-stranded DNA-binding protein n=1 Tax=Corynebacterium glaucum TaxID=187491 RepID=UPI0025B29B8B|nr:single-stranded DNA-binding protein [Corynebacterium glaucum]WJZ08423.1 Single-stranded DNA-binding protein 2 [Corynebacterium glaucum]